LIFESVCLRSSGDLIGYAVGYLIPFTFDLRPSYVLKELYVAKPGRRAGVGAALFNAVVAHARSEGCRLLKWDVLPHNLAAQQFYAEHGGEAVCDWQAWRMTL
jgi:GNAT superfamily N-acetyltransferase